MSICIIFDSDDIVLFMLMEKQIISWLRSWVLDMNKAHNRFTLENLLLKDMI